MLDIDQKNKELRDLLGLTEADIQANRTGKLGENQRERLRQHRRALWRGLALLYLIPLILPVIGLILINIAFVQLAGIFLIAMWSIGFIRYLMRIRQQQRIVRQDIANNDVQSIEGAIWRDLRDERNYFTGIDEHEFPVQRVLYELMEPDQPAVIYHLGNSRNLIAMEYIQGPFDEENMTI